MSGPPADGGDRPIRYRRLALRAAAELGVIVIGVTIALWADGWASKRNDRARETARLHALRVNVDDTLTELRGARADLTTAAAALRDLASPSRVERDDGDLERAMLQGYFFGSDFAPELSVYDDLKSSGELSLLTNAELRRALSAMDSRIERLGLALADMATVQQLNLDSYLIRRVDLVPILGGLLQVEPPAAETVTDFSFTADPEFRNLVLFKLDLVVGVDGHFERTESELLAAQRAIAAQLDGEPARGRGTRKP
jgi:hypothetical protein